MRCQYISLCFLSIFILSNSTHAEEPKTGQQIGDWTVQCVALTPTKTQCSLTQTLSLKESKQPVLRAAIGKFVDISPLQMLLHLPLGVDLLNGIQVQVDQEEPTNLQIHVCAQQGCEVLLKLNKKWNRALKAGNELKVTFRLFKAEKANQLSVSLTGLTKAMKAFDW